ncbi:MAG: thiamine-binding protein [Bacteroidetes bacterium]|nr:thiamine-binding protein [Bacteroidota bacterium]
MAHIANVALQIIPKATGKEIYPIIDKAIEVIQKSGLKYKVCPFETVMEGPYDKILTVIEDAQQACFIAGAEEVLVYVKIQRRPNADVFMEEKTGKYEKN